MKDGWLQDQDVVVLARQALDDLDPAARVEVVATNRSYLPAGLGTLERVDNLDREVFAVLVRLGQSKAKFRVDSGWSPAVALGNLFADIAKVCGGRFRSTWWPACPSHEHAATVTVGQGDVVFLCPSTNAEVRRLTPATRVSGV